MLVRGTQAVKPQAVEYGKDTIYERKNIRRVEETATEDGDLPFLGWEYEEQQYTYQEWQIKSDLEAKLAIVELAEALIGG